MKMSRVSSTNREWHSAKLVANNMVNIHRYDLWMTATYLDDIMAYHRGRAAHDARVWQDRLETVFSQGPSLLGALSNDNNPNVKVIAEIKRRSPSKGWIDEHLDAANLADAYQRGGASAISVLTDEQHFSGSVEDFAQARSAVTLPLLRKDFTVSANDVLDGASMGASAVLLIVAALSDEELRLFFDVARQCGLDALVEVHDSEEAKRALDLGAALIGVNQRDLRSFEVSPDRAAVVITSLPASVVSVCESGISSQADVERASDAGFDAVLVGETFVRSPEPATLVQSFATVASRARG
jgi:indole-3-glycerol phosphate synthase